MINIGNSMTESTHDGDSVSWNRIKVGDIVGWTIEGMGKLPKVGSTFRVGPFTGTCTKSTDGKVFMKIEGDSRSADLNESKGMDSKEESLIKKQLKSEGFSDEDIKIIISAMSKALSESMEMNESLTSELKSLSKAGLMVTCDDGKPFFSKMDRLISDLIRNKQIKSVDDMDTAKIEEIDAKTTRITTKSGTQFVISKMN